MLFDEKDGFFKTPFTDESFHLRVPFHELRRNWMRPARLTGQIIARAIARYSDLICKLCEKSKQVLRQ